MVCDENKGLSEPHALTKAKAVVFRLFRFRPRSEQEIAAKLAEKGFDAPVIAGTVAYFKKIQLIDDALFARGWIQSRLNKPFGIKRIRLELKNKGVDDETLNREFGKAEENYSEQDAIFRLAAKRLKTYQSLEKAVAKRRLSGYLLRRGFSPGAVSKTLNGIFNHDDDSE